ncbi:MAG TPA: class I lanthipeptide [Thermoanaerobaculia bacterium]|nr:class I lanthipeptide [Thermoanaerobaculia bacterium]
MKKKIKKLALNRETLRDLEEGRLKRVAGASDGSDGIQCNKSQCLNCPQSWNYTCGTAAC